MTRSLQLDSDGDLAVIGRQTQLVSGRDKLKQDLDCWLREKYQVDRFHPYYGSTLDDFIGGVVGNESAFYIRSEVIRVLNNFQQLQVRRFQSNPELFSSDQILNKVLDVKTLENYDTINVMIFYEVASGRSDQVEVGINV